MTMRLLGERIDHTQTSLHGQLAFDLPPMEANHAVIEGDEALLPEPFDDPACSIPTATVEPVTHDITAPSAQSDMPRFGWATDDDRRIEPSFENVDGPAHDDPGSASAPQPHEPSPHEAAPQQRISRPSKPSNRRPRSDQDDSERVQVGLNVAYAAFAYRHGDRPTVLKPRVHDAILRGWAIVHGDPEGPSIDLETSELHGILSKQPLLAMLGLLGSNALEASLETCVGTYLRSLSLKQEPTAPEKWNAHYGMSLAIRGLRVQRVQWLDSIISMAEDAPNTTTLANALKVYRGANGRGGQKKHLDRIERAFAFLMGHRNARPRSEEEPSPEGPVEKRRPKHPNEAAPDADLIGASERKLYDPGPSRSKYRRNPIPVSVQRSINQHLVNDERHYMTSHDMMLLREELLSADSPCRAVLAACLWGGLWADDLSSWRTFADVDAALATTGWDVAVIVAPLAFLVTNGAQGSLPRASTVAATHLYLPLREDRPGADALKERAAQRQDQRLFEDADRRALNTRLLELRTKHDAVLTTASVQRQMKKTLTHLSGDTVLGAILSGKPIPTHLIQKSSYRQWRSDTLMQRFHEAGDFLDTRLQKGSTHWGITRTPFPNGPSAVGMDENARVGSLRCPSDAETRAMTTHLRRGIHRPPAGRPHPSRVIEFHRRFMAYTTSLLLWATGARPGEGTLRALQTPVDDMIFLAEKATTTADRRHRKRIVRLSPLAMSQRRHWMRHRDFVRRTLSLEQASTPVFFDVDDSGRSIALTHANYKRLANHPLCQKNAARHALSSALLQRGVAATRVNTLLGHALVGEEIAAPFNAGYPSFSDCELRVIDEHLLASGFRPLPGYRGEA
ncbi:hypothetical protein [Silanimonas sp.]|uniref:hypothetical protein n=1 Tax=Silanimonas sp. TaxID=1929290 RepID=UPI0022CA7F6F|nr:hypothetical protein [Silanimonas sp.]MCZ8115985.1 hypothetical protein [Silanimonas sp.]